MISFHVDISGSVHSPIISEVTNASQEDDFEAEMGNKHLNSEEKVASQRVRLTGANKRMFNLLKKAKVQLIKIDQQKQLKSVGVCVTYKICVFNVVCHLKVLVYRLLPYGWY